MTQRARVSRTHTETHTQADTEGRRKTDYNVAGEGVKKRHNGLQNLQDSASNLTSFVTLTKRSAAVDPERTEHNGSEL